jgi:UrcA family protein
MSIKIIVTTIVAMGALAYAVSSHAAGAANPDTVSVGVTLSDLDLDSQSGAAVALARVDAAAGIVCGGRPAPMELDRQGQFRACRKLTADRAVASLGNPIAAALSRGYGELATFLASR